MPTYYPKNLIVQAHELLLADVVRLVGEKVFPYDVMTVKQVTTDKVVCFRPYTQTADFEMGCDGGKKVICYVGIEEITYFYENDNLKFEVFERNTLR